MEQGSRSHNSSANTAPSLDAYLSGSAQNLRMDMNRNNRRKSVVRGAADEPAEFSQQSILSAMDRFVSAVNNMDDTIMVPSRLLDMSFPGSEDEPGPQPAAPVNHSHHHRAMVPSSNRATTPPAISNAVDMYGFYNMLNTVKNELIWGPGEGLLLNTTTATTNNTNGTITTTNNSHSNSSKNAALARRMSTVSVHSYSDSDVESESSTEFDSGVDVDEQSVQVATSFRQHLTGLFQALHQLTDAANYLTTRYQEEVGGAS